MTATNSTVLYRLWALASPLFTLVIAAGALSAVAHWRPGAYLAVGGLTGLIGFRCALAVLEYRRVMSRPWPKVAPLTGEWDE